MDAAHAERPSLPPIKMIDVDSYRRDEQEYLSRRPPSTILSAATPLSSAYPSGPPPPYSAAPQSSIPADYRLGRTDARDVPEKGLLPPLHEALGVDRRTPYQVESATTRSPPSPRFLKHESSSPRRGHAFAPLHITPSQSQQAGVRRPSDSYEPRRHDWPEHHSATSTTSYRQRTPPSAMSQSARPPYSAIETTRPYEASPHRSAPSSRPTSQFPYGYSSTGPSTYTPATVAPTSQYPPTSEPVHTWRPGSQVTVPPPTAPAAAQPYGESVKRHLDLYDMEMALNEIRENSTVVLDFSKSYGARMHQIQRSGIEPGVLPAITEVDALLKQTQNTMEALGKMREVLIAQHALHRQQVQEQASRTDDLQRSDSIHQQEDSKAGGFAGSEPKKRRGRNAAPGRCHSCNRAETPEWRRGPDGARTLCNACGLHYAKLTRKAGANKAAVGGSSLRPKDDHNEP